MASVSHHLVAGWLGASLKTLRASHSNALQSVLGHSSNAVNLALFLSARHTVKGIETKVKTPVPRSAQPTRSAQDRHCGLTGADTFIKSVNRDSALMGGREVRASNRHFAYSQLDGEVKQTANLSALG